MSNFIEYDPVMTAEDIEDQKKQKIIDDDDDVFPSPSYLPEDLLFENILTRLPAKDLARFTSVSHSWYNSILNETQFSVSHFARHRNRRNLSFNLLNVSNDEDIGVLRSYFFNLHKDSRNKSGSDRLYDFELVLGVSSEGSIEVVGNCNGLVCVKDETKDSVVKMTVLSSFRKEALTLTYKTPEIGEGGGSLRYLCHGFGFDSLSQKYKVVVVYRTINAAGDLGLICMVITLGDAEWRKIVISPSEISPPPGRLSFPSQMVIYLEDNMYADIHRSATICGGDLLWRIGIGGSDDDYDYDDNENNEIEMLLSFDVHNEKLQFIRLPNECNSLITPIDDEYDRSEFRHHLLEFKGFPCVASSEKTSIRETVDTHSNGGKFLCYQFMVRLFILKDKVEQLWIEEETFDVSVSRDPFDRYFYRTKYSTNHRHHHTRISSFSDQVMLYWFDGRCLIFYNLVGKKDHHVAKGTRSRSKRIHSIFQAKLKGLPDFGDYHDVPECPCIDYQLHAQEENIISLKTFIPEGGEVGEFVWYEDFR